MNERNSKAIDTFVIRTHLCASDGLHFPLGNDGDSISQHLRLVHVVRGEQHSAVPPQRTQQIPQLAPGVYIHACCWLIQGDKFAASAYGDRDGHFALLAA